MRSRRIAALALALALSACTSGTGPSSSGDASSSSSPPRRHAAYREPSSHLAGPRRSGIPANYVFGANVELYRCCLLRNLYSFSGRSAEEGGGLARPDLATGYPDVTPDGLTWTIHIQQGIHYAPPYQSMTVTSDDVINGLEHLVAFEREAPPESRRDSPRTSR